MLNYSIHIQHKDIMGIQDVHYAQEHPRYYNIEWTLQLHVELNTICQMSIGLFCPSWEFIVMLVACKWPNVLYAAQILTGIETSNGKVSQ